MATAFATSIVEALLELARAPHTQDANNHFSLEGLALRSRDDGTLEIGIRRLEAVSLRLASQGWVLEIGRLAVHGIVALVRLDAGGPRLRRVEAASAELAGVQIQAPLSLPPRPPGREPYALHAHGRATTEGSGTAGSWNLGPLGTADGTLRAEIVDAHLLFDADVTVPIRQGRIDFNEASVEHVGPDSRMGASRLGLYVDAPNGRSYLYQFPSTPAAGVEYERRGVLPGPWGTDRGNLRLQPFAEGVLRQLPGSHGLGFTEQARLLFDRTALSGELRLGDGKIAAPGVQAELVGRAEGHNAVRIHSEAVGRGLTVDMDSLSVQHAALQAGGAQAGCDALAGVLKLRLFLADAQLRLAFDLETMKLSGLRAGPGADAP